MRQQRRTWHFAVFAAVALSLSACTFTTAAGSPGAPAPSGATPLATTVPAVAALYQMMLKNCAAAESVHVKGAYTDNGQKLHLDVAGDRAGTQMRLLVDFGDGAIEILKVNDGFYLKAHALYWTRLYGSAVSADLLAGRYVKVPAGAAAGMGGFRVGTLIDRVLASGIPTADMLNTDVQTSEVHGTPAYLLTTKVTGDARIYVSTDGKARLLRTESAKNGALDFTEWDSVAPIRAPTANQLASSPRTRFSAEGGLKEPHL